MPKAYIVGHITVRNPEPYKEYVARDTPVLAAHGAKFLVRGGRSEVQEGSFKDRHVVFEFPSFEAALAAWNDPEYQEIAEIRRANADSDIVIVEGTE